jgi:DNA-binding GntR family transcriptional regulator
VTEQKLQDEGAAYRALVLRAERQREALHRAIRDAVKSGLSESEAARVAGVTRMTVRKALGK